MNLLVDIGNTFIKIAIYNSGEIVFNKKYKLYLVKDLNNLRKKYAFTKAIVSSVRKNNPYFVQHLSKNYNLVLLDHNTKVAFKNLYKTPKTLGKDRIAAVAGALKLYPGKRLLVIDIGTCITYDYINTKKIYHGGNISPGVELRLQAMHQLTSNLPLVSRKYHKDQLGKSTKSALQNGAVWGIKSEIEGFIKTLTKKEGSLTVILTGGDAEYFGEILESKIFVDPNLVLKGLNELLEQNN